MSKVNLALAAVCLLLLPAAHAHARDIALAWNDNPEQDVAGYKIYYRPASPTPPFDGIEANEGASPIDIGDATTFSLTGLAENQVYYFAVVAYNTNGVESGWSDIIASNWVPTLVAPDDGAQEQSTRVRFIWEAPPAGHDATYTLYFGTDPHLAGLPAPPTGGGSSLPAAPLAILLLGCVILASTLPRPRRRIASGAVALSLACALTACGGDSPQAGSQTTVSVYTDRSDYYEAYDLQPGTTYYWKVVAVDAANPQMELESLTRSFISN